ncbi:MAG: hypothetical protein P8Y95_13345 [Gammaproteobacteria bacterium]|jgi:hypothetical protein
MDWDAIGAVGELFGSVAHVITHIDELPDIERGLFDRAMQMRFGGGGVSQFIYETHLKPTAHPEIVGYIENVLSRTVEAGGSSV